MLAQKWKEPRSEVKRQWQRYSTCWTTEEGEGRICSARVTEIDDDEGKEGLSGVMFGHRQPNEVWRKGEGEVLAGRYLQACT